MNYKTNPRDNHHVLLNDKGYLKSIKINSMEITTFGCKNVNEYTSDIKEALVIRDDRDLEFLLQHTEDGLPHLRLVGLFLPEDYVHTPGMEPPFEMRELEKHNIPNGRFYRYRKLEA